VTLGLADPNLLEVTRVFDLSTVEVAKRAPGGPAAASFAFDISCTWTTGRRSEAVPLNDRASDSLRLRKDGVATRDVIGGAVGADVVDGRSASMLIIAGDTARFAFLNAYPLPVTGVVLGLLPVAAGSLILAGVVVLSTRRRRRPPREASGAGVRRGNYD